MHHQRDLFNDDNAAEQNEKILTPATEQPEMEKPKRNCGRTGATSEIGKAIASRNATKHSMCAQTLILAGESEQDWQTLLYTWLADYQNPAENSVLYTFVVKTAQAEWFRLRIQKQYDFYLEHHGEPLPYSWPPEQIKQHDLMMRYVTAAERRFQREYRLLEHHSKAHPRPAPAQQAKPDTQAEPKPEPPPTETPRLRFINNETGESVDAAGNHYPPPPDYKSEPIVPGVYRPCHPASQGLTPPKPGETRR